MFGGDQRERIVPRLAASNRTLAYGFSGKLAGSYTSVLFWLCTFYAYVNNHYAGHGPESVRY